MSPKEEGNGEVIHEDQKNKDVKAITWGLLWMIPGALIGGAISAHYVSISDLAAKDRAVDQVLQKVTEDVNEKCSCKINGELVNSVLIRRVPHGEK